MCLGGGVGGIAHSPGLGLVTLVVAGVMIWTMDSYFGIAAMFKKIAMGEEDLSWRESVVELHRTIGVASDHDLPLKMDKASDSGD